MKAVSDQHVLWASEHVLAIAYPAQGHEVVSGEKKVSSKKEIGPKCRTKRIFTL